MLWLNPPKVYNPAGLQVEQADAAGPEVMAVTKP
jgi:hypothetical protein